MVLLVIAGQLGAASVPAFAGNGLPPCGSDCDLRDPQTWVVYINHNDPEANYHCADDAVNIRTRDYVWLRYSPHCETTWAKPPDGLSGLMIDTVWVKSFRKNGTTLQTAVRVGGGWTLMLDDHGFLNEACVDYRFYEGDSEHEQCTAKY